MMTLGLLKMNTCTGSSYTYTIPLRALGGLPLLSHLQTPMLFEFY